MYKTNNFNTLHYLALMWGKKKSCCKNATSMPVSDSESSTSPTEVQSLLRALLVARNGPVVTSVLVDGEPGSGKTHSIQQALQWARSHTSNNNNKSPSHSCVDHVAVLRPSAVDVFAKRHKTTGCTALAPLIGMTKRTFEMGMAVNTEQRSRDVGGLVATLCVVLDRFDMFLASNSVALHSSTSENAVDSPSGVGADDLHLLCPHFVADFLDVVNNGNDNREGTGAAGDADCPTLSKNSKHVTWRLVVIVTTSSAASSALSSKEPTGAPSSGASPLIHPQLRRRLFRWFVRVPIATEPERAACFLPWAVSLTAAATQARLLPSNEHAAADQGTASSTAVYVSNALAARSGGLTYAGLVEVWDAFRKQMIQHSSSMHEAVVGVSALRDRISAAAEAAVKRFYLSGTPQSVAAKRRVGYVDVVRTQWTDIAGLRGVKDKLKRLCGGGGGCMTNAPNAQPSDQPPRLRLWQALNKSPLVPSTIGVVLHGPPGTGKTMLAKAMACELSASFIFLDLPQLIHGEVGESEATMRRFFHAAQRRSPCVMFMDEVQAAFGRRDDVGAGGGAHDARLVSCFLSLLDETQTAHHADGGPKVWFVCATNAIQLLDPLLLRAGRLDQHLFVGNPDDEAREHLVRRVLTVDWAHWWAPESLTSPSHADSISRERLQRTFVSLSSGMSGAELHSALNVFALTLATTPLGSEVNASSVQNNDANTPAISASSLAIAARLRGDRLFHSNDLTSAQTTPDGDACDGENGSGEALWHYSTDCDTAIQAAFPNSVRAT